MISTIEESCNACKRQQYYCDECQKTGCVEDISSASTCRNSKFTLARGTKTENGDQAQDIAIMECDTENCNGVLHCNIV